MQPVNAEESSLIKRYQRIEERKQVVREGAGDRKAVFHFKPSLRRHYTLQISSSLAEPNHYSL